MNLLLLIPVALLNLDQTDTMAIEANACFDKTASDGGSKWKPFFTYFLNVKFSFKFGLLDK